MRWPVLDLQWAIPLWLVILCAAAILVSGAAVVIIGAVSYMLILYPIIVKGATRRDRPRD